MRLLDPLDRRTGEFANTPASIVAQTGLSVVPRFRVISVFQRFDRTMFDARNRRRDESNSLMVSSSTDVGTTWTTPTPLPIIRAIDQSLLGQPSLSIDPAPNGSAYFARPSRPSTVWLVATGADPRNPDAFAANERVNITRSTNGGETFEPFRNTVCRGDSLGVCYPDVVSFPSIQSSASRLYMDGPNPLIPPFRIVTYTATDKIDNKVRRVMRFVRDTPDGFSVANTVAPEDAVTEEIRGLNRTIVRGFGPFSPVFFWETRDRVDSGLWSVRFHAGYLGREIGANGYYRYAIIPLPAPNLGRPVFATAAVAPGRRSTGVRMDTHFDAALPGAIDVPTSAGKTVQIYQGTHTYLTWVGALEDGQPQSVWYQRGTLQSIRGPVPPGVSIVWDAPVEFTDRPQGSIPFYPTITTLGEEVANAPNDGPPLLDSPALSYYEYDPATQGVRLLVRRERRDLPADAPIAVRWPVGNLSRASRNVDAVGEQPICSTDRSARWGSFISSLAVPDITTRSASAILTFHTESEAVGGQCANTLTSAFVQRVAVTRWQVSDLAGLRP